MSRRESVYLEKRHFEPINEGIKNSIDLCKDFINLYENDHINKQDLIYIAPFIDGEKPGISCCDNCFSNTDEYVSANQIRESHMYNILTDYGVPFRIDVYGNRTSRDKHHVDISKKFALYTISRDFSNIQNLPPFHYIGENNSMYDIERKYMTEWGEFLGVPEEDCAWMNEEHNYNMDKMPKTIKGLAYIKNLDLDNIDYACLVPYKPRNSKEGIERAINVGERYYKSIKKFDDVTGEDYGMQAVEEEIYGLTSLAKRDVIKYEIYELFDGKPILHNDIIMYVQNKYDYGSDLITEKLLDIDAGYNNIERRNDKYVII